MCNHTDTTESKPSWSFATKRPLSVACNQRLIWLSIGNCCMLGYTGTHANSKLEDRKCVAGERPRITENALSIVYMSMPILHVYLLGFKLSCKATSPHHTVNQCKSYQIQNACINLMLQYLQWRKAAPFPGHQLPHGADSLQQALHQNRCSQPPNAPPCNMRRAAASAGCLICRISNLIQLDPTCSL